MPVLPLKIFFLYKINEFRIGGNATEVADFAKRWKAFGDNALASADKLRSINNEQFLGAEGERYKQLVNSEFPNHLKITGESHNGVSDAVGKYAAALSTATTEMNTLVTTAAEPDHAAVQAAVGHYNACEARLAFAAARAVSLKTSAVCASGIPVLNGVMAGAAAAAQADWEAAQLEFEKAKIDYAEAKAKFEKDVTKGAEIKTRLSEAVKAAVSTIEEQARKRFEENPNWVEKTWNEINDHLENHSDEFGKLVSTLRGLGRGPLYALLIPLASLHVQFALAKMMFKGLMPVLAPLGSFAVDLFSAVPGGKTIVNTLKGLKELKPLSGEANAMKDKYGECAPDICSRGGQCKLPDLEPVEMATGEMINFVTDVSIDGILPMVIDRNSNSSSNTSMVLGAGWNSTLDTRIEILEDKILMLSPDGALLEFPPAPLDGSEVIANGRPWRLSFVDGAYRVRNIQRGLTWVFAVTDVNTRPQAPVEDVTFTGKAPKNTVDEFGDIQVSSSFINMTAPGSVADTFGVGVEIYLSATVHHTGAWIEYDYEQTTGNMIAMRRSDGTVLDLKWHRKINRLASVWVRNEETHPSDEPMRLISYKYDGRGRLLRVINSAAGALRYYYDDQDRPYRWTDRNGYSYFYRFDDQGRVIAQVGTGGMFPNAVVWLDDTADDAPTGGKVCVALECAGEFHGDPIEIGASCIDEYFERLENLPIVQSLQEHGLAGTGLTGRGRTGTRDNESWTVAEELLTDDFLGDIRPTVYRSTPAGDVWRVITAEGKITDREFNQYHQVIKEISNTGVVTSTEFDEYGNTIAVNQGDGASTVTTAGAWGAPLKVTGQDGLETEYELDPAGLVTATTDAAGVRTEYEYEWRASGLVPLAVIGPNGLMHITECDNAGRVIASVDTAGRRSTIIRDVRGLVSEMIDPIGNTTKVECSPEGWVTKITYPDGSERTAMYDGEGNQVSYTNEIAVRVVRKYTVFDRLQEVIAADGGVTKYTYNTQMEKIAVTNADGHTWRFEYDLDGKIAKEIDYNGYVTETNRSRDGLSTTFINGENSFTAMYDAQGHLMELQEVNDTTRFTRNAHGVTTQVSNSWSTIDYQYDKYGRFLSETMTLYSGEVISLSYHYAAFGGIEAVTQLLPNGQVISEKLGYNEKGELTQITHYLDDRELAVATFGIDELGRRHWSSVGSLVRNFTFDDCNRILMDITSKLGSDSSNAVASTVVARSFSWRPDDVLMQVVDTVRGTTDYTVDDFGRVIDVNHGQQAPALTTATPVGSGASAVSQASESYGFSKAGVLTKLHPDTSTRWSDDIEFVGTRPHRVGRTMFTYDKAGRVIQTVTKRLSKKPLVKTFYYGSRTQPIGYTDSDHPTVGWRYLYDGLKRRIGKECIDVATNEVISRTMFLHRGNHIYGEQHVYDIQDPAAVGVGKLWPVDPGTGEVCGQIELKAFSDPVSQWSQDQVDAVFYSMVSDLTGVPKELIDTGTGEIVGYSKQTLFGERQWFGDVDSPLLFAGQYEDLESGWVYNRYRYYNAKTGAYNAQDPLGLRPNIASPQAYVTNPTTGMDALGLEECSTGGDIQKNREQGKEVEKLTADDVKEQLNAYNKNVDDPLDELHMVEQLPIQTRVGDQVIASNADILIYDKRGNSRILELKSGGASLSPNQRIMRDITELTAVRDKLEDDLKEAEEELKKLIEKGASEESIAEAKKTVDKLKADIDSELEKVHKYDKDLEKRIALRSHDEDKLEALGLKIGDNITPDFVKINPEKDSLDKITEDWGTRGMDVDEP